MKHIFTITAEYANGFDGKVIVEVSDPEYPLDLPIGEGYADTLSDSVALAFAGLEIPTKR